MAYHLLKRSLFKVSNQKSSTNNSCSAKTRYNYEKNTVCSVDSIQNTFEILSLKTNGAVGLLVYHSVICCLHACLPTRRKQIKAGYSGFEKKYIYIVNKGHQVAQYHIVRYLPPPLPVLFLVLFHGRGGRGFSGPW